MGEISLREQLRRARVTAREALVHWGLQDQPLRVLRNLQNTSFKVGDAHVLRLSHAGYQSDAAIESEVTLLEYLSSAGLAVPRPIRPDTGERLIKIDGARAVLFPWVQGRFASASFGPRKAWRQGELVGRLHEAAVAFRPPPGFHRLAFTPETLLAGKAGDDAGELSRKDISAAVGRRKADVIERSAELVRETWATLGANHVLHTDITPWNTMWCAGRPFLIDFDDAAIGPLAYDLGVVRCEYDDLPSSATIWEHFVAGYTSVRALPPGLPEGLLGVVAGRHLLFATWLILNIDHPAFSETRAWLEARVAALSSILEQTARGPLRGTRAKAA